MACEHSLQFKEPFWTDAVSIDGSSYLHHNRAGIEIFYPAAGSTVVGIVVHKALSGKKSISAKNRQFQHQIFPTVFRD